MRIANENLAGVKIRVSAVSWRPLTTGLAAIILCAGCKSITGIPSLDHHLVHGPNPSVNDLIQHTNCEIAKAMAKHIGTNPDDLWDHLWKDNFVASIDFTLTATNSEGFNPSVSGILPTYSLGGAVSPVVGTSPTVPQAMATSAMYNKTLAVGLQANRTQDRNLDVTYTVDLSRLADIIRDKTNPNPLKTICGDHDTTGNVGLTYVGLEGDLEIGQTMLLGLQAIDAGKEYGVYGTSGPQSRADAAVAVKQQPNTEAPPLLSRALERALAFNLSPTAAQPPGAGKQGGSGAQSGSTSFSSKIDFTIVEGVNGGPSFNLLTWKVGGGAGGGGGGAGAGGGGGGGGGGTGGAAGGGGGGQMFNWNRTVVDSLVVTFVPTCSSIVDPLQTNNLLPPARGDGRQVRTWYVAANDGQKNSYLVYRVVLPDLSVQKAGPLPDSALKVEEPSFVVYRAQGNGDTANPTLIPTADPPQFGSIQWNGYFAPAVNTDDRALDARTGSLKLELRGAIDAPLANNSNSVGTITLVGAPGSLEGHITTGLYEALSDDQKTLDYWQSIQSCDLITTAQKQESVSRATTLNQLFKLTNAERHLLQQ